MMAACSDDVTPAVEQSATYLTIEAKVEEGGVNRAAMDATGFQEGDRIGIFVRDAEGNPYLSEQNCSNLLATFDGNQWVMDARIALQADREAMVYAYAPYDEQVMVSGDSITIDLTRQLDILYGNAEGVTPEHPMASISFRHALARISVSVTRDAEDTGEGRLTCVRVRNGGVSDCVSLAGKMSLANGGIEKEAGDEACVVAEMDSLLSLEATDIDLLVLPTDNGIEEGEESPSVDILLTIDGKDYIKTVSRPVWQGGCQYIYPLKLRRTSAQPVDPEAPENPVDPENPENPVDPEDPENPVDSEAPGNSVDPVEPEEGE